MTEPVVLGGAIAYLTGEYPRATDTFIQREVSALRTLGIDVRTCSIRETGKEHLVGDEQKTEAANTFHVLKAMTSPRQFLRSHFSAIRKDPRQYFRALALAWRTSAPGLKARAYQIIYFSEAVILAEFMRTNGIVHLHNHIAKSSCTVAMLASEMSGIPFSFTLHGPDIFFEPIRWRLDEKIARAHFVACISNFCRSQAMVFSNRAHWSKLHIVHCGINPDRYHHAPSEMNGRLLFVGRLASVKGVPVLFEAMARLRVRLPDLRLTLIGDGPERAELEQDAKRLGIGDAVIFSGYKSQDEVAEALANTDLLVLPSFAEGVPVVLMEAMAAQVPVVATRIAGISELVENGVSGVLVAPGDAAALADGISYVLRDAERMAKMGASGRAKVQLEFDISKEARWLATLMRASLQDEPAQGIRPDRTSSEKPRQRA